MTRFQVIVTELLGSGMIARAAFETSASARLGFWKDLCASVTVSRPWGGRPNDSRYIVDPSDSDKLLLLYNIDRMHFLFFFKCVIVFIPSKKVVTSLVLLTYLLLLRVYNQPSAVTPVQKERPLSPAAACYFSQDGKQNSPRSIMVCGKLYFDGRWREMGLRLLVLKHHSISMSCRLMSVWLAAFCCSRYYIK